MRHPRAVLRTAPDLGQELIKIGLGASQVVPGEGDKRFADPTWRQNPWFRATVQSYFTWGSGMERYLDNLGLPGMNTERMRFGWSCSGRPWRRPTSSPPTPRPSSAVRATREEQDPVAEYIGTVSVICAERADKEQGICHPGFPHPRSERCR